MIKPKKTIDDRVYEGQSIEQAFNNYDNSKWMRSYRLTKRVKIICSFDHVYFITFTIDEKHYGYKRSTYRRKVKKILSDLGLYVANDDYGKMAGRYHLHAILGGFGLLNYNKIIALWQYGNVDFEPITQKEPLRLKNYIIKLTLHAEKETARDLIYSRGFDKYNIILDQVFKEE